MSRGKRDSASATKKKPLEKQASSSSCSCRSNDYDYHNVCCSRSYYVVYPLPLFDPLCRVITLTMSIEVRSKQGIKAALKVFQSSDYANESTIHVKFHSPFFVARTARTNETQLQQMLIVVGRLPLLEKLSPSPIVDDRNQTPCCHIPVKALAVAIQHASQLQIIEVCNLKLVGDEDEFKDLAQALEKHTRLKSIIFQVGCLEQVRTGDDGFEAVRGNWHERITPLNAMIASIGNMHQVEEISFTSGWFSGCLKTKSVENVGGSAEIGGAKASLFPA